MRSAITHSQQQSRPGTQTPALVSRLVRRSSARGHNKTPSLALFRGNTLVPSDTLNGRQSAFARKPPHGVLSPEAVLRLAAQARKGPSVRLARHPILAKDNRPRTAATGPNGGPCNLIGEFRGLRLDPTHLKISGRFGHVRTVSQSNQLPCEPRLRLPGMDVPPEGKKRYSPTARYLRMKNVDLEANQPEVQIVAEPKTRNQTVFTESFKYDETANCAKGRRNRLRADDAENEGQGTQEDVLERIRLISGVRQLSPIHAVDVRS